MNDHRTHLLLYVIEGVWGVDGETDENNVRIRVGEGTKTVIVLLPCGIPEGEFNVLSVDVYISHVVLEDGRNVNFWERSFAEMMDESVYEKGVCEGWAYLNTISRQV